jgi:hypothetical protein
MSASKPNIRALTVTRADSAAAKSITGKSQNRHKADFTMLHAATATVIQWNRWNLKCRPKACIGSNNKALGSVA